MTEEMMVSGYKVVVEEVKEQGKISYKATIEDIPGTVSADDKKTLKTKIKDHIENCLFSWADERRKELEKHLPDLSNVIIISRRKKLKK